MKLSMIHATNGIELAQKVTLAEFFEDFAGDLTVAQANEVEESLRVTGIYIAPFKDGSTMKLEVLGE